MAIVYALCAAATAAVGAVLLRMLAKEHARFRAQSAFHKLRIDQWRDADEAYFAAARMLLSAKRQGATSNLKLLESLAEELWEKAEAARRRAIRRAP